jgi:hypothetical protein
MQSVAAKKIPRKTLPERDCRDSNMIKYSYIPTLKEE